LTYESNRLHIILGLASHVSRATKSEYLYGTWIEDLPLELYWIVQPRNGNMFTCRRPEKHRAPTWCWSWLEGPIRFMKDDLNDCTVCFEKICRIDTNCPLPAPPRPDALNLSAHVRTCEVSKNGVWWINGVTPEIVTPDSDNWVPATKGGGLAILGETGDVIGGARFDLRPTEASLGRYTCLLLFDRRTQSGRSNGLGLLLWDNDGKSNFMRAGTVILSPMGTDWLRGVERQCVTLI
jgi:hypothetical protein